MILNHRVRRLLENNPHARERKNRYRSIWYILNEKHHMKEINKNLFIEIGPEIDTINRIIRQLQQLYPELRGEDYDDKKKLVQKHQMDLGYEVDYFGDIKRGIFYEPQISDSDIALSQEKEVSDQELEDHFKTKEEDYD